jgi:hypothetical protein
VPLATRPKGLASLPPTRRWSTLGAAPTGCRNGRLRAVWEFALPRRSLACGNGTLVVAGPVRPVDGRCLGTSAV